jgi:hypothetical protein
MPPRPRATSDDRPEFHRALIFASYDARPMVRGNERAASAYEPARLACMAASLAALLCWGAPPGTDFAAHAYQREVFLHHGFQLWNNLWYAGHYSFVTYSILYYPLAALFGIRLLAVATVALGSFAFTSVLRREWGLAARWASVTFAALWGAFVLTGAFPFALGWSLGLLAISALQRDSRWAFALCAALTLAASPLAFLLFMLLLAGVVLSGRRPGRRLLWPVVAVVALGVVEVLLWRLFPSGGRYPFSLKELTWALGYCAAVVLATWRVEQARLLRFIFFAYAGACIVAFFVPSAVGQNIDRFRFVSVPVIVLALSLRGWRPRVPSAALTLVVLLWNVTPLAASLVNGSDDASAKSSYWEPATSFLKMHLTPSYRVEVVGTARHWEAVYLPQAGIPLTRGWYRQDDFPENKALYEPLTPTKYLRWLHSLGVRYVVLTGSAPDYSARAEAALISSGSSGLQPVLRTADLEVLRVPAPLSLLRGPSPARVLSLSQTRLVVWTGAGGAYRLAVRYSPYWEASAGCVIQGKDGMTWLRVARAGVVSLTFRVTPDRALDVLTNTSHMSCAAPAVHPL